MIRAVKRLLLIFLLAILPLQYSWAAAAVYCQHEKTPSTHFGHHTHEHHEQAGDTDHKGNHQGKIAKADNDCGVCHLSAQPSFPGAVPAIVLPDRAAPPGDSTPYYSSHIPDRPAKPDWRLLA